MPALFLMLIALLIKSFTLEGFGKGFDFVFGFYADELTAKGVLEALGHAFFSLSLGMGSMLTYAAICARTTTSFRLRSRFPFSTL